MRSWHSARPAFRKAPVLNDLCRLWATVSRIKNAGECKPAFKTSCKASIKVFKVVCQSDIRSWLVYEMPARWKDYYFRESGSVEVKNIFSKNWKERTFTFFPTVFLHMFVSLSWAEMSGITSREHSKKPAVLCCFFFYEDKNRSKVAQCWPFGAEHLGSVFSLLLRGFGRSRFDVAFSDLQETHRAKRRGQGTGGENPTILSITAVLSPRLNAWTALTSAAFIS